MSVTFSTFLRERPYVAVYTFFLMCALFFGMQKSEKINVKVIVDQNNVKRTDAFSIHDF